MRKKADTVKVSLNVPSNLLEAIDDYCIKVGVTRTSAFNLFLYRGASFEQEVLQVLGNKKKLKRLNAICNEEYLKGIDESIMKAGNMVSNASYADIYKLSGLTWHADELKSHAKALCRKLDELDPNCTAV